MSQEGDGDSQEEAAPDAPYQVVPAQRYVDYKQRRATLLLDPSFCGPEEQLPVPGPHAAAAAAARDSDFKQLQAS